VLRNLIIQEGRWAATRPPHDARSSSSRALGQFRHGPTESAMEVLRTMAFFRDTLSSNSLGPLRYVYPRPTLCSVLRFSAPGACLRRDDYPPLPERAATFRMCEYPPLQGATFLKFHERDSLFPEDAIFLRLSCLVRSLSAGIRTCQIRMLFFFWVLCLPYGNNFNSGTPFFFFFSSACFFRPIVPFTNSAFFLC